MPTDADAAVADGTGHGTSSRARSPRADNGIGDRRGRAAGQPAAGARPRRPRQQLRLRHRRGAPLRRSTRRPVVNPSLRLAARERPSQTLDAPRSPVSEHPLRRRRGQRGGRRRRQRRALGSGPHTRATTCPSNAICVGASNAKDEHGVVERLAKSVDLFAPGEAIHSTFPPVRRVLHVRCSTATSRPLRILGGTPMCGADLVAAEPARCSMDSVDGDRQAAIQRLLGAGATAQRAGRPTTSCDGPLGDRRRRETARPLPDDPLRPVRGCPLDRDSDGAATGRQLPGPRRSDQADADRDGIGDLRLRRAATMPTRQQGLPGRPLPDRLQREPVRLPGRRQPAPSTTDRRRPTPTPTPNRRLPSEPGRSSRLTLPKRPRVAGRREGRARSRSCRARRPSRCSQRPRKGGRDGPDARHGRETAGATRARLKALRVGATVSRSSASPGEPAGARVAGTAACRSDVAGFRLPSGGAGLRRLDHQRRG